MDRSQSILVSIIRPALLYCKKVWAAASQNCLLRAFFVSPRENSLPQYPHQLPKISLPAPFALAAVKADDIVKTRKTFCSSIKTAAEGLFPVFFWLCVRSVFIPCLHEKQPDGIVLVLCPHNAQTDDPLDVFAQDIVQRGALFRPDSRGGSRRLFVLVCFI